MPLTDLVPNSRSLVADWEGVGCKSFVFGLRTRYSLCTLLLL
jgi:hypothetical protein